LLRGNNLSKEQKLLMKKIFQKERQKMLRFCKVMILYLVQMLLVLLQTPRPLPSFPLEYVDTNALYHMVRNFDGVIYSSLPPSPQTSQIATPIIQVNPQAQTPQPQTTIIVTQPPRLQILLEQEGSCVLNKSSKVLMITKY